jgi:hypothetical protein
VWGGLSAAVCPALGAAGVLLQDEAASGAQAAS